MKKFFSVLLFFLIMIGINSVAFSQTKERAVIKSKELKIAKFSINGNSERTNNRLVTLNFSTENGKPTSYSVSENPEFVGKIWLPYTSAPTFWLSNGVGLKDIYFAVANATDTSATVSNKIYLDESVVLQANGLKAKLFPNPVETTLNVALGDNLSSVTVVVYSLSGQKFLSKTFHSTTFSLDLTNCPSGPLLVRLSNGNNFVVQRIIKL